MGIKLPFAVKYTFAYRTPRCIFLHACTRAYCIDGYVFSNQLTVAITLPTLTLSSSPLGHIARNRRNKLRRYHNCLYDSVPTLFWTSTF